MTRRSEILDKNRDVRFLLTADSGRDHLSIVASESQTDDLVVLSHPPCSSNLLHGQKQALCSDPALGSSDLVVRSAKAQLQFRALAQIAEPLCGVEERGKALWIL